MKSPRTHTFKPNSDKMSPMVANLARSPRQSEPYLCQQQTQLAKSSKDALKEKLVRKSRNSEVVSPESHPQHYFSPKSKKIFATPSLSFLSPPHNKPPNKFAKCTSSNALFFDAEPVTCLAKKNKQGLEQSKTRINVIENHLKTLDKIEQMLSNHGIQMNSKIEKPPKENQDRGKKSTKAPRFSQHLMSQHELQFIRKETESFGNEKKVGKDPYLQPRELKDTVSTSSTLKQLRQLKIGDFQMGREIGRGRFGVVKEARHKKTGLIFAIKVIKKSVVRKEQIVEQLIKQIKIQYFLNQANIVKLYTVFDDPQNCYLLLELCCEGNLYQKILKQEKFPENEAREILKNICQGLFELHSNSIMHRDLKPENVVMHCGMAKLCDFGWSTLNNGFLRETFCGTPLYVSPQLLSGNSYDERVDLWSIGILGYEMLTGRIPFDIKSQRDLNKIVDSSINFPDYLSPDAVSFLQSLLSKEPEKRTKISQLLRHSFFKKK